MFQGLGQDALPKGNIGWLLGWLPGVGGGVGEGTAADAIFEDRKAGVNLTGFFHERCVMGCLVAGGLGAGKVN